MRRLAKRVAIEVLVWAAVPPYALWSAYVDWRGREGAGAAPGAPGRLPGWDGLTVEDIPVVCNEDVDRILAGR